MPPLSVESHYGLATVDEEVVVVVGAISARKVFSIFTGSHLPVLKLQDPEAQSAFESHSSALAVFIKKQNPKTKHNHINFFINNVFRFFLGLPTIGIPYCRRLKTKLKDFNKINVKE